jgi:hypothetical protein
VRIVERDGVVRITTPFDRIVFFLVGMGFTVPALVGVAVVFGATNATGLVLGIVMVLAFGGAAFGFLWASAHSGSALSVTKPERTLRAEGSRWQAVNDADIAVERIVLRNGGVWRRSDGPDRNTWIVCFDCRAAPTAEPDDANAGRDADSPESSSDDADLVHVHVHVHLARSAALNSSRKAGKRLAELLDVPYEEEPDLPTSPWPGF